MDTAFPQKIPFILDRNLAKANCTEDRVCTSCDKVVLAYTLSLPFLQDFIVKGFIMTLVSKLDPSSGQWRLPAKINDGTASLLVSISNTVKNYWCIHGLFVDGLEQTCFMS